MTDERRIRKDLEQSLLILNEELSRNLPEETDSCLAIQEIPEIVWKPSSHFRVRKALDPILNRLDPVHSLTLCFCKVHFNVILRHRLGLTI
jgi:hypothetical protein